MMMALVFALATVLFDELDAVVFRPINNTDVRAVRTDNFHMFFDLGHVNHSTLRGWKQSTLRRPIKFAHWTAHQRATCARRFPVRKSPAITYGAQYAVRIRHIRIPTH